VLSCIHPFWYYAYVELTNTILTISKHIMNLEIFNDYKILKEISHHFLIFAFNFYKFFVYITPVPTIAIMIASSINGYKKSENTISHIIKMYFEIFLIFTTIYFVMTMYSNEEDPILTGTYYIGPSLDYAVNNIPGYLRNLIISAYLSLTTMVTYSDGTVQANWIIAKIAVASQLIISFSMTVFVIGRFFSGKP
jgi:hypothetical protein